MTKARRIEVTGAARREIKKIKDKGLLNRLVSAIDGLAETPHPPGSQKLTNVPHLWRIRVGDYRILYAVEEDVIIIICSVRHRKDVYRDLDGVVQRLASVSPDRLSELLEEVEGGET